MFKTIAVLAALLPSALLAACGGAPAMPPVPTMAPGLPPARTMKDADMIFGYVGDDGAVTVLDVFSTGSFGPHPADTELGGTADILEAGGSEAGGFTTIEFKRALATGDSYDLPLQPGANRIIWAYGPADSPDAKHASRGYGEITIQ